MDRRVFVSGVTLGLLTAPFGAQAQQVGTVPRIGYPGISPSDGGLEPFRQGLRELGRVEGQSIAVEYRWTGGKSERLPELVTELIRLKVDVIYTPGSVAAAQAAKQATTTRPRSYAMAPVRPPAPAGARWIVLRAALS
jgi:putative ABC transport system substrate-binding protein